jgi:cytochrome bd-type quinol oxidase subunit 1
MKPTIRKAVCRLNSRIGQILFNIILGVILYVLFIFGALWVIEQFLEEDLINRNHYQECPNGPRPSPSSNFARHLEM